LKRAGLGESGMSASSITLEVCSEDEMELKADSGGG